MRIRVSPTENLPFSELPTIGELWRRPDSVSGNAVASHETTETEEPSSDGDDEPIVLAPPTMEMEDVAEGVSIAELTVPELDELDRQSEADAESDEDDDDVSTEGEDEDDDSSGASEADGWAYEESESEEEDVEAAMDEGVCISESDDDDKLNIDSVLGFAAERRIVLLAQTELASLLAMPDDAFGPTFDPEAITADYYGSLRMQGAVRALAMLRKWAKNKSALGRCVIDLCKGLEFGSVGEYLEHACTLSLPSLAKSAKRALDTQVCGAGIHLWTDIFYFLNELREVCAMVPDW